MKNLQDMLNESLLDNIDALLNNTNIPNKPKVDKKDYFTYEQAWYNVLVYDFKWNKNDKEKFIKFATLYNKWSSGWDLGINYDDFDYDLIEDADAKTVIDYALPYIEKESNWAHDQNMKQLKEIVPSIYGKNNACDYFWGGPYEGILEDLYEKNTFSRELHYSQYYNAIKKYLQMFDVI